MKTLITAPSRDSFIKTVQFLSAIGLSFPTGRDTTEENVAELYDLVRNRWDTAEDDVMAICIDGEFFTINTKRHYKRESIDNETVSPIM